MTDLPIINKNAMPTWILRISAILEIGAIYLGGTLIARFIGPLILPDQLKQDANELFLSSSPDFIEIAAIVAAELLLRFGVMLGLALAFGWWHRRRNIDGYGITTAGKPIKFHILSGILIVSVGGLIPRLLITLREYISLGSTPLDFEILFSIEWTYAFWVYMAVSSFILIPIVEELFFRGYVQTRLTEEFGVSTGILMTALIFTFSHTKYFAGSVFSLGMLGSLLISSLILGYMRHKTGSLIPGTIGHGLSNLPTRGIGSIGMLIGMIIVIILNLQQIKQYALGLRETLSSLESPRDFFAAVLILVATLVIVLLFRELLSFVVIGMGLGAILIAIVEKRKPTELIN